MIKRRKPNRIHRLQRKDQCDDVMNEAEKAVFNVSERRSQT